MEQTPCWQDERSSASQEIPRLLCNPNVQYSFHKDQTLVHNLNHKHPVNIFPAYFSTIILMLSSKLRIVFKVVSSFKVFDQTFVCITHLSHVFYTPSPLILLYSVTLLI
jgi:hypothetical protein